MAQPKKLSNTEKYCIQGMLHDNKSFDDIASEINRPLKMVQEYAATLEVSIKKTKAAKKPKPPAPPKAKDLMVTRSEKGRKGITMMTEAASYRTDENRDNAPSNPVSVRHEKPRLHIIREED